MAQTDENTVKPLILLTGPTGYIGGRLLTLLDKQGYNLRCLSRVSSNLRERVSPGVEVIIGNALNYETALNAMKGVDTAVYLIHSMASEGDFSEIDRQAAQYFGEAASECKVRRIIYVGGLGSRRDDLSKHLKSRQEVGNILRQFATGVQVIEFRSSVVIGAGSLSFEMIRALCERLPIMVTPKWVSTLLQPIYINDLLEYIRQGISVSIVGNPIIEIGGKYQVSYQELMAEYCRQRGLKRFMIPIPFLTPRLSSYWLALVTPLYSKVGRNIIESASCSTIVSTPIAEEFFHFKPIGYKEAIANAIHSEDVDFKEPRWIDSFAEGIESQDWGAVRFGNRLIDSKKIYLSIPPSKAFAPIRRIGGNTGYYYGKSLWWLRGILDLMVGGVGIRRGRRDPENLEVGDVVDFWRVEAYEPNKRLLLRAEMRVPGRAWLEYSVDGGEGYSTIRQTAIFDPIGVSGIIYWYLVYPAHKFVFAGMIQGMANAALRENYGSETVIGNGRYLKRAPMPVSVEELFSWHMRKGALDRLLPPWENIKIEDQRGTIAHEGTVTISIRKFGIPFPLQVKHKGFIKDRQFQDEQIKGPFKQWEHTHLMTGVAKDSSLLEDSITYELPGGSIGEWLLSRFCTNNLKRIFRYRHSVTYQDLRLHQNYKGRPLKIVVAGSSGLIGGDLVPFLTSGGHQVVRLTRHSSKDKDQSEWHPERGEIDTSCLEGVDAVVNLAGEPLAVGRWTLAKKERILQSRIQATKTLAVALSQMENPPKVWINISAVGFYGNRGDEILTEQSSEGQGFLAEVCHLWEEATLPAVQAGIRVVNLRLGVVLSAKGGALPNLLVPFHMGVGNSLGSGSQYVSWIAMDDVIGIIHFALTNEAVRGVVNAVSPNPVTNLELTKTLGRVLNRPLSFPVPAAVLRLALGEMADEMLLSSCRASPQALKQLGYQFLYPGPEEALGHLLGY